MLNNKILVWDIETGYALATIFSLFAERLPHKNIIQEWYMISAAWKWLGESKTHAISVLDDRETFSKDPTNDYVVIKKLHEVLSQADAIVHHFGDRFDLPKLNTRFIALGFDPIPPLVQIDTYKIAKKEFKFMSNRLDYIAKYLGFEGKMHTPPELWLDCLQGKVGAVRTMVQYNKQDVDVLEQVYIKLAPFTNSKFNQNVWSDEGELVCSLCGESNFRQVKDRVQRVNVMRQVQCKCCGKYTSYPVSKTGKVGVGR